MKVTETTLPGVYLIEPRMFPDQRGFFQETWQATRYAEAHIPGPFVQDNHSHSTHRTLRGLHYQLKHPQGKLVWVLQGEAFDVVADIRVGSPTFGRWFGTILSGDNHRQLYVPADFAHGFCVLSASADFLTTGWCANCRSRLSSSSATRRCSSNWCSGTSPSCSGCRDCMTHLSGSAG